MSIEFTADHPLIKNLLKAFAFVVLVLGGIFWWQLSGEKRTLQQVLKENEGLKQAITNLNRVQQIGYAKVLSQETRDGALWTRILFVQTEADNPTKPLFQKEYEIEGDIAHFDGLIVRFKNELVMDDGERAIFLWRRLYGEKMTPEQGILIEQPGTEPAQYAKLCRDFSIRDRALFWKEIWALADDPARLEALGISAIYGNVVYRKLQPGLIYIFKLTAAGTLYPEVIPDL